MSTERQHAAQAVMNEPTRLLSEFPYPRYEEWRDAAEKLLKGAPFEKKLFTKTYEGITLQPVYRQQDVEGLSYIDSLPGFAPYVRGSHTTGYKIHAWDVSQEIPYADPESFNAALQHDLEWGQTAVNMVLDKAAQWGKDPDQVRIDEVGKGGTSISTLKDLEIAFAGIDCEHVPIFVQVGASTLPFGALLIAYVQKHRIAAEKLRGCIESDPLGLLVSEGTLPLPLHTAYDALAGLTGWVREQASALQTIAVHSFPYHNGGSHAVQELAFTIATGVEYLREMQARGLDIDDVAPRMRFAFSVGTHYFMEIAKLRAARLLWAKAVKAFEGNASSQKMSIHVRTALWNKTIYDPYVNMLRTTVEAFAGVVGGCDSMHVGSFDEATRLPDKFSRRIARNAQIILKEEAHLNEVIDPAGGSWYVERLTDELARKAWTLFQEVERHGGMAQALQTGFPQKQIAQNAAARAANLSTRKDVLIGTNIYPNLGEKHEDSHVVEQNIAHTRIDYITTYRNSHTNNINTDLAQQLAENPTEAMQAAIDAAASGATLGMLSHAMQQTGAEFPQVEPVQIHRAAEMFESLRAATDAYTAQTGVRPAIFMANMGPIPQHKARADFAIGFFQVGGFDMLRNEGFATVDDAARAAIESNAPAMVICSTDATYPDIVPALTQQVKAAKSDMMVILAGYPKDHVEAFKAAGVDEFIHLRANMYEILVYLLKKLNILTT